MNHHPIHLVDGRQIYIATFRQFLNLIFQKLIAIVDFCIVRRFHIDVAQRSDIRPQLQLLPGVFHDRRRHLWYGQIKRQLVAWPPAAAGYFQSSLLSGPEDRIGRRHRLVPAPSAAAAAALSLRGRRPKESFVSSRLLILDSGSDGVAVFISFVQTGRSFHSDPSICSRSFSSGWSSARSLSLIEFIYVDWRPQCDPAAMYDRMERASSSAFQKVRPCFLGVDHLQRAVNCAAR